MTLGTAPGADAVLKASHAGWPTPLQLVDVSCPSAIMCVPVDSKGNRCVGTRIDDSAAPAITIGSPTDGEHFTQNAPAATQFSCDDGGGSGVASCSGNAVLETTATGTRG